MDKILNRLLISITSKCNLRCRYCYVYNEGVTGDNQHDFKINLLDDTINEVYEYYQVIKFIQFFGGEPHLSFNKIIYVVDKIKSICDKQKRIYPAFGVISNFTLFNNEIAEFYKKNNFKITISLDGDINIHDYLRRFKNGNVSYKSIIKNIELLKKHNLQFDIECTYTSEHINENITIIDLLKHFISIYARRIDIVPVMLKWNHHLSVYNDKYFSKFLQYYSEAIDFWFNYYRNGGKSVFGIIGEIIFFINNRKEDIYCPAGIKYLAITPNGNIYPCHLFFGNKKFIIHQINSINQPTKSKSNKKKGICNDCPLNLYCFNCVGKNNYFTGDLFSPNKFDCLFKYEIINKVINNLKFETAANNCVCES